MSAHLLSPLCDRNCPSEEDCQALCGCNPPWLRGLGDHELYGLLDFANRVQAWSYDRQGDTTFAEAASHFGVTVERINQAVVAHYWMFADDPSLPMAERRIEHDGE